MFYLIRSIVRLTFWATLCIGAALLLSVLNAYVNPIH